MTGGFWKTRVMSEGLIEGSLYDTNPNHALLLGKSFKNVPSICIKFDPPKMGNFMTLVVRASFFLFGKLFFVGKPFQSLISHSLSEKQLCWIPWVHHRSLTARPWKMVLGRRSFPIGKGTFQGLCPNSLKISGLTVSKMWLTWLTYSWDEIK